MLGLEKTTCCVARLLCRVEGNRSNESRSFQPVSVSLGTRYSASVTVELVGLQLTLK